MKRKPKSEVLSARKNLRWDALPPEHAEPPIKPVMIDWDLDVETVVWSGVVPKLSINMEKIKRRTKYDCSSCSTNKPGSQ